MEKKVEDAISKSHFEQIKVNITEIEYFSDLYVCMYGRSARVRRGERGVS